VWSNITEEDIEAATDIPVPAAELAMPGAGGPPGAGGEKPPMPGSSAPKPAAPAKKPAPAGSKDAAYGNGFYDPDNLPTVTPYPGGTMPSAVTPGARPFEAPGAMAQPLPTEYRSAYGSRTWFDIVRDFYNGITGGSKAKESDVSAQIQHTLQMTGESAASMDPKLAPDLNRVV